MENLALRRELFLIASVGHAGSQLIPSEWDVVRRQAQQIP
jgi:hypothetical protein